MDFVMPNTLAHPTERAAPVPLLRALVADDDPGSRRFLSDGLCSLAVSVQSCGDGVEALRRLRETRFDLVLLDCRMPGAGAQRILTLLRRDPSAGSADAFAVATSAELAPADRRSLLAAGFNGLLSKPCGLADLRRILVRVQPERFGMDLLDDDAALLATGDAATMRALRLLLGVELSQLDAELDRLNRNPSGFAERLHRLRSSCGFCGATALSEQVVLLQRQLEQGESTRLSLVHFRKALHATLDALNC
jgi:CheY-like chemotaxis protein